MASLHITDGPAAHEIFTAALHATNPKWRTPLEFTLQGTRIVFNWVNAPTWMGERSKYLTFEVRYDGSSFRVEYDTKLRIGEMDLLRFGR